MPGGLVQRLRVLLGEIAKLANGRIFFEDDLALSVRENLQRVAFPNPQRAADFLGYDDPAKFV